LDSGSNEAHPSLYLNRHTKLTDSDTHAHTQKAQDIKYNKDRQHSHV